MERRIRRIRVRFFCWLWYCWHKIYYRYSQIFDEKPYHYKRYKFLSLKNQPWTVTPVLIDLNSDENYYYPFMISIDRCGGNCNATEDSFDRIFHSNTIESVTLKAFNTGTGINKWKELIKRISCNFRSKLNGRKCN